MKKKRYKIKCRQCRKIFEVTPYKIRVGCKYCSNKCRIKALIKKQVISYVCLCCKKEFKTKQLGRKYCSCLCAGLVNRNRIVRVCIVCSKNFVISASKGRNTLGRYCSRKCFTKGKIKKIVKHCEVCGAKFTAVPSQIKMGKGRYCSKKCFDKVPKKPHCGFQKGHKFWDHPNVRKVWIERKGIIPKAAFKKGFTPWNKGKYGIYSNEYRKKMSESRKGKHYSPNTEFKSTNIGKNAPSWKGGITDLHDWIRTLSEYKEWRKAVFQRDNYTCQKCGEKRNIHAHHKKTFSKMLFEFLKQYDQFSPIEDKETLVRLATKYEPFWDINNGQTLCKKCHKKTGTYLRGWRTNDSITSKG